MESIRKIGGGLKVLNEDGVYRFVSRVVNETGVWNTFTSRYPIGTNVFEHDWDLLVILDACRVDALRRLVDSKNWLYSVGSMWSVGSMTAEWYLKTFSSQYRDVINETAIVSGHGWTDNILKYRYHRPEIEKTKHDDDKEIRKYNKIYRGNPVWDPLSSNDLSHYECLFELDRADDERLHPESNFHIPHIITDRAIAVGREKNPTRLIIHYGLPHVPFIADALDWQPGESTAKLMDGLEPTRKLEPAIDNYSAVRNGEGSPDEVQALYMKNLQLGLDYLDVLLKNYDADKVVISADHGEALGESNVWGHPYAHLGPSVKKVPWAVTTATDERTYEPTHTPTETDLSAGDRKEFLENMGYL